jgi:hypothetical protein
VIGFVEVKAFTGCAARSPSAKGEREKAKKAGPARRPILQYGCSPYARIDSSIKQKKKEPIKFSTVCV